MAMETVLLISGNQDFASRLTTETVGLSLCLEARHRGGDGWAGWLRTGDLTVRIHGFPLATFHTYMDACFASIGQTASSVRVVEKQVEKTPLPNVKAGDIPWGTLIREKLTKKLLKLLPEGAYVVSNLYAGHEEIFAVRLLGKGTRDDLWGRAVRVGANKGLCRLVWTDVDFNGPPMMPEANLGETHPR